MDEKAVAIDFDGTIFEYDEWKGLDHVGPPLPGVKEAINDLMNMGYKIIIYTTRTNSEVNPLEDEPVDPEDTVAIESAGHKLANMVADHLDSAGIPWDEVSISKPVADFYIDDRAIRFENWNKTLEEIKERRK